MRASIMKMTATIACSSSRSGLSIQEPSSRPSGVHVSFPLAAAAITRVINTALKPAQTSACRRNVQQDKSDLNRKAHRDEKKKKTRQKQKKDKNKVKDNNKTKTTTGRDSLTSMRPGTRSMSSQNDFLVSCESETSFEMYPESSWAVLV